MVHQVSSTMSDDRPIAGLIWGLESEGWSLAEHLIIRSDGQLTWIVSGFNGPNAIRSQGASMAEAWAGAAEQARTPRPGSARLDPPGLPWTISYGLDLDPASADSGDRPRPADLQFGRVLMAMDKSGEHDAAARPGDKLKPKHRVRRRGDGKVQRGRDLGRRANPNRN